MRVRATTVLFIVTNIFIIAFRTVQISVMTAPETAFLKDKFFVLSIVGTVLFAVLMLLMVFNALSMRNQPESIIIKGKTSAVFCAVSALLLVIGGGTALLLHDRMGTVAIFVLSLIGALCLILYTVSAVTDFEVPKIVPLGLTVLMVAEFVFSYIYYTTKPLRVRTVYETLAIAFSVCFFLAFGKVFSRVNPKRNIRFVYPLGLMSSTFCFASVVPELISGILGFSNQISVSCVSQWTLISIGLFTAFVSLKCFKRRRKTLYKPEIIQ